MRQFKGATIYLLLLLEIILAIGVFYYPVKKPVPVGVDAVVYLNEIKWIQEHGKMPLAYQPTYHGYSAYPAPATAAIVNFLHRLTGLNPTYPLFSVYQLGLIVLLVITSFFVGQIYGRRMAVLFPLMLMGSYGLIRLFVGSTVSNILAFSLVNIAFIIIHRLFVTKHWHWIIWLGLITLLIMLTHSHLTAPIFLIFLALFFIYLVIVNKTLRTGFKDYITGAGKKIAILIAAVLIIALPFVAKYAIGLFQEAQKAFWQTESNSRFIGAIMPNQYATYLGSAVSLLALVGIALFIADKRHIRNYRVFPLLWLAVLFTMMQTYVLGINFYYERILFLAAVFIAFFAAWVMNAFIEKYPGHPKWKILITTVAVVIVIVSGASRVKSLYDASNLVTAAHIEGLEYIRDHTPSEAFVYSNINAVSGTKHDVMIADRTFRYITMNRDDCVNNDQRCLAFTAPADTASLEYFTENGVEYFLFILPSRESQQIFNQLVGQYKSSVLYQILYENTQVVFIKIRDAHR